ncbi:RNA polymerase sigma factor [Cryobacterium zhongshanensis]|uniref:RNA polymerase sigma-70 region 2 domain-containing protein n=1 Tax=Cryobacterium zhongshanensis TaxID=2928153 RepID=A0AA41QTD1_9MICO|nr:sigma factor [Cryobacterium zhongshanensis]MCI4656269.1 hypothetical protein [Cryobacterium zhongshanensis]
MDSAEDADWDLVRRAAAGDRRAFGVLFDRHSRAVTRYVWVLLSDQMDVEEVVQDTFVTAWAKAGKVQGYVLRSDAATPELFPAGGWTAWLAQVHARYPNGQPLPLYSSTGTTVLGTFTLYR